MIFKNIWLCCEEFPNHKIRQRSSSGEYGLCDEDFHDQKIG